VLLSALLHPRGREEQLAHALRRVPLFREAPARDLVALWRQLAEVPVRAGEVICRRGDPGDRFYVVQAGSVEVRLGAGRSGISLYRLGPGDCFGEMALLTGAARSADVVAAEDSVLWALDRSDFDRILNESVPLLRALNRSLAQRIAMTTALVEESELAGPARGPAGLRFGPYRVVAQIGAGGMAVVYSAVRGDDEVAVALKMLPAGWGDAPELRARLEREAAILQRIDHPGVIRLLDVGEVAERLGGGTFVAMEWLPHALDRVLRAQYPEPFVPAVALRIARDVADALGAVHATGVIHRDVKPSNVLLRADGHPVLTDFGLSAALADLASEHRLTPSNVLVGTADYLAPEQIAGTAIDGRADLYALGVVLYELLAGYVPFAGRDPLETLRAHVEEPPPPLPFEVPPTARAIVERALRKDPDERYRSAPELAKALDAALGELRPESRT
jgi:CRP-like cAMP-binding protein